MLETLLLIGHIKDTVTDHVCYSPVTCDSYTYTDVDELGGLSCNMSCAKIGNMLTV